jgi:predicted amino acid-binding ACT domain protein
MNTQFPHAYVLNVMSDDHPGIVSAVSTAVAHLGGNIDAASQTVLGGYFTLIMVVSQPQPQEARDRRFLPAGRSPTAGVGLRR